jgi:hypothetical protein
MHAEERCGYLACRRTELSPGAPSFHGICHVHYSRIAVIIDAVCEEFGISHTEYRSYAKELIEEQKNNPLLKFLSSFWGPIPWMIEASVILSGVDGHWPDFFIILFLLIANAVIGFWEEHEAGNAIAALKSKLAVRTRVKRDGQWAHDCLLGNRR